MKQRHEALLRQAVEMAEEGKFGEKIKAARREYERLPVGIATLLKCVADAYSPKPGVTGGEDGPFYLISRIARPSIRNAIAHGAAWLDSDAAKVRYSDGRAQRRKADVDLLEFGALAMTGSHLAEPYLAALGTIAVMEDGSDLARQLLPAHLAMVFGFQRKGSGGGMP